MQTLTLTYHLDAPAHEAEQRAEALLLEQTVETPRRVAERVPFVREQLMGRVVAVETEATGGVSITLELPTATAFLEPAQLLNILFGNASLHPDVSLQSVRLPDGPLPAFLQGPRFGAGRFHALAGVAGRPLTCGTLKPVGLRTEELARMCATYAEGGLDFVKDDHNLAEHPFSPFEARVHACLEALREVEGRTGRTAVYVPNLSGTPSEILRQAETAQRAGARAVMVAPMLIGLPFFSELVRRHLEVPVLAHPSFAGAGRIATEVLLGTLFRLFGADAVIFASHGGRFGYGEAKSRALVQALRAPRSGTHAALPVPAGGMTVERAGELVHFYGIDTMLLVGGSLLDTDDLLARTRLLAASVADAAAATENAK